MSYAGTAGQVWVTCDGPRLSGGAGLLDCDGDSGAGGLNITEARLLAREQGWAHNEGGDWCPRCWARRVRYRAGRPVSAR